MTRQSVSKRQGQFASCFGTQITKAVSTSIVVRRLLCVDFFPMAWDSMVLCSNVHAILYFSDQPTYCCKSALATKCEREDMIYYRMWEKDDEGNDVVIGENVWDAAGWANGLNEAFPTILKFDPKKPTIIVSHGLGGCTTDQQLASDYKAAGKDYNVIGIRWHYNWASECTRKDTNKLHLEAAGEMSARFIQYMMKNYGLKIADIHAIGFSYGTNVLGIIEKHSKQ